MIWVTALQLLLKLDTYLQTLLVLRGERSSKLCSCCTAAVVLSSSALSGVSPFGTPELDLASAHLTQLTIAQERVE